MNNTVPPGYKQTEVGVILEDWEIIDLGTLSEFITSGSRGWARYYSSSGALFIRSQNVRDGQLDFSDSQLVSPPHGSEGSRTRVKRSDLLITITGNSVGNVALVEKELGEAYISQHVGLVRLQEPLRGQYVCRFLSPGAPGNGQILVSQSGQSKPGLTLKNLQNFWVALPPPSEQRAIATALSDVDALISGLDRLIAKKRDIKQAAMQQLLTGKQRLPGFDIVGATGRSPLHTGVRHDIPDGWEVKRLGEIVDCLDNLRVPLNESQRDQMRGDYPYCGANGVLDFVNDYVIDDDILLMAEDGGYFDEHSYRPIVYRMVGKCWVNNHAHVLKAKENYDQGYIFYSLVHKNIMSFLASGTRAKLNKSEMNKIEVQLPLKKSEQAAIASILSDMDADHVGSPTRQEPRS